MGLLVTGAFLCVGIIFLHNRLLETEGERALRAENKILKTHKPVLEAELLNIESTLHKLKAEDQSLYTKLFNTTPPTAAQKKSSVTKEQVLLADASQFRSILTTLEEKSTELAEHSTKTNQAFGNAIHVDKTDVDLMVSIPSRIPLADPAIDKLASGFGKRVNPFHKGMYFHPGLDFVAPRGTEVYATAPGVVRSINKTAVEAGYGNSILINHGNGLETRYAHLEEIRVKPGQKIAKGMVIGTVGNSGGSMAPHLHYEIIRDGDTIDPAPYIMEGLNSQQYSKLMERSKKQNQSLD